MSAFRTDSNGREFGRHLCDSCKDSTEEFRTCRVCGGPVPPPMIEHALRRMEQMTCSSECLHSEQLARYACCEKAVRNGCVCVYSTSCPDHGVRCHKKS
jgi:hypothetical protein